jgi:hypothetical protein
MQPYFNSNVSVYQVSWSFVILVVVAGYTANLASFLTLTNVPKQQIRNIRDAIEQGARVCYTREVRRK